MGGTVDEAGGREPAEGVIKYQLTFHEAPLVPMPDISRLEAARDRLRAAQLVGQDPGRYEGLGFGNLSERLGQSERFLITGSQTGHRPVLTVADYAEVLTADPEGNRLEARGQTRPSSEALTHALLYALSPQVGAVVHVHCPRLWGAGETLGLPCTPAEAPYGSPALVRAVRSLWQAGTLQQLPVFVMLGHEDGIVAWGPDVASATDHIFHWLARA